jgi:hypothetical protein
MFRTESAARLAAPDRLSVDCQVEEQRCVLSRMHHRSLFRKLSQVWLASLCWTGCVDVADEAEPVAQVEQALGPHAENWYKATLDQSLNEPQERIAELDMVPGRLTGVPVSKAWFGKKVYRLAAGSKGTHNFKATCVRIDGPETLPPAHECDSGMLIKRTIAYDDGSSAGDLFYSDNDAMADNTNGGSHVDAPFDMSAGPGSVTYQIVVFSRNRQSSHVNIWRATNMADWSTQFDAGGGHDTNGWSRYVGGTVVRLGPLAAGDYVEVRTRSDGAGTDKTWMWVFPGKPILDAEAAGTVKLTGSWMFANYAGPREFDPKITIPSSDSDFAQAGRYNYAILSREAWQEPQETFVDLVRGPLSRADGSISEPNASTGTVAWNGTSFCTSAICESQGFKPKRGRHQVTAWGLPAKGKAVGSTLYRTSVAADIDGSCRGDWQVGAPNSRAFRMTLQIDVGNGRWFDLKHRDVPMASLADESAYSALIMELEADGASAYRLRITSNVNGNSLHPTIHHRRNVDSSTLKVATFNHYFETTGNADGNMAWLLGRRPEYDDDLDRILEHPNRAPYEQEADVVAFQEVGDGPTIAGATRVLNGGYKKFDATMGQLEYSWFYYADGTLWVNDLAKGRYASSAIPDSYLEAAGCPSTTNSCGDSGAACSRSCNLGTFLDDGLNKTRNALPVRGAARRLESDETALGSAEYGPRDKKIMYVNLHFHLKDFQRAENVKALASKLDRLVRTGAGERYFSAHGALDDDLRIVLMGDSNGDHQQCAEMNSWLRELRATFGYALFAPMAALDRQNRTIDNFFGGAPLDDPQAGMMTELCQRDWWARPDEVRGGMCPKFYQGKGAYERALARGEPEDQQWHHWWTPNNDIIVLVGRGWRSDDPVQGFKTLGHRGYGPGTDDQPGGISSTRADRDESHCAADDGTAYLPRWNVYGNRADGCTPTPGAPGIGSDVHRSDHPPVMAKLRIN